MSKDFEGRKVMRLLKTAWQSNRRLVLIRIIQGLFEALISMADILGIGVIVDVCVTGQNRIRVFGVIILYVLIHSGISLIRILFFWLKDTEERKEGSGGESERAGTYLYHKAFFGIRSRFFRRGEAEDGDSQGCL